jgi:hypothetical protein
MHERTRDGLTKADIETGSALALNSHEYATIAALATSWVPALRSAPLYPTAPLEPTLWTPQSISVAPVLDTSLIALTDPDLPEAVSSAAERIGPAVVRVDTRARDGKEALRLGRLKRFEATPTERAAA